MAYVQTLTFNHNINTSLQVGDQVYMTSTSTFGGFDQNPSAVPIHIGHVHSIISSTEIEVYSDYVDGFGNAITYNLLDPNGGDYISFSKRSRTSSSSWISLYARWFANG